MTALPSIEEGLISLVIIQIAIGILQFLYYPTVRNHIATQVFPDKSYSVSIIVPIKGATRTLKGNFRSLCTQKYPDYEVIFVSELEDDTGVAVANEVIAEWRASAERIESQSQISIPKRVTYLCAGEHTDLRMIAKSHNLIAAVGKATGEVLLFTDSDVFHPENWVREMVNPIGEVVRGKDIHATTAVFFIDPEGFLGIFPSLSTNAMTYLASFTRRHQDLPAYASGASMAVRSSVFHEAGIIDAWRKCLNDDLVLAGTLVDKGYNLFSVRRLPTRPVESFTSWRGMNDKMVRWMLTANHYTHPRVHKEAYVNGIFTLQFQTLLNISIILAILQGLTIISPLDWTLIATLLGITYLYNVLARIVIALNIQERNVFPYIWLSPLSQYFWGWYFILAALVVDRFTWGGKTYVLRKRFGRLTSEND
jgi:cellulose synthase/poly-beta-1,6-N-acetylglucosamine synthase-like glycosyltransferase